MGGSHPGDSGVISVHAWPSLPFNTFLGPEIRNRVGVNGESFGENNAIGVYVFDINDKHVPIAGSPEHLTGQIVPPTPAAHVTLTRLKAGESVYQADKLPKTL